MGKSELSISRIIGFCGACIAFYIGAGFATMQEVMQYYVFYGSRMIIAILIAAAIYIYTNISFAVNGSRRGLQRGGDIYRVYAGKAIGIFYDIFSAIFCYMCFVVMCGGANSTASQQWGLPNGVGAIILTAAVVITAVFGLNGILKALGKIGPIIIVLILCVSVVVAANSFGDFLPNLAAIDAGEYELIGVGSSPWASGASYGGFVILWFAAFLAEIGAKNKLKEVNTGMLLSALFIFAAAGLCCIALVCRISSTAYADIPALILANSIHPLLGQAFAIIIFCGIYTTAVPLLWTGVGRIAKEGTRSYRISTIIGGAVGCAAACFLPYKGLVNVLYGLNGYLGFILVAFMIISDVRTRMGKKEPGKLFGPAKALPEENQAH